MTYPTISPSLTLDFAKSKQLDPRITFTRSSTATYLDAATELIKTVPSGVARFEKEGLLIEESRTNLVRTSTPTGSGLSNGWTQRANTTITTNAGVAPDGTTTATSVVANLNSTDRAYTQHTLSSATTADCVVSAFAKPINNFPSTIIKSGLASGVLIWNFNFQTEATTVQFETGDAAGFGSTAFMEPLANGWYRVGFTAPAGLSDLVVNAREVWSGNPSADGVSGVLWWGCQVEEGSSQTSFIPTSGSTVTRSADVVSITGTNFSSWYNQGEGTAYIDWSSPSTDRYNLFAFSDGTTSNRLAVYTSPTANVFVPYMASPAGGFDQSVFSLSSTGGKYSMGYIAGDTQPVLNGSLGSAVVESNLPTNSRLNIGADETQGYPISGHITRLSYYSERVSDASLQELTS